jgi:hypothetical protein
VAGFKSIMRPEGSIMAGVAVGALVAGVYQLEVGSVSAAGASEANHPILDTSKKKAGYTSLVLVSGVALLARDPNILILGGSVIIAMELSYRHAIMQNPQTGTIVRPGPDAYQPAQNVVPLQAQGATG